MALLNFPPNPNPGDTYTIGYKTYYWNGNAWIVSGTAVTATSVYSSGVVAISNTSSSTSTNTGALTVSGGAGIGGNLNVGGSIVSTNTSSFTTSTFQTVRITGGTSATNTTTGDLVVSGGVAIQGDLHLGGTLYSSGVPVLTTSTFVEGIADGQDIDIVDISTGTSTQIRIDNISTLQSVTGRGNSTSQIVSFLNTSNSTSTTTGAVVITGGLGVGGRITSESLRIADAVFDSSQTMINTTASTVVDVFNVTEFRGAKYLIQIDEGTGPGADFELIEILLVADNDGNVWATEYGVVTSNGDLGTFQAEIFSNEVRLYFTAYAASNKKMKVLRTGMAA